MRRKKAMLAIFALAASMAFPLAVTGCVGGGRKGADEQAAVPERESIAPMGLADSGKPGGQYGGATREQSWEPEYSNNYGNGQPGDYNDHNGGGRSFVNNPFTSDLSQFNPQQSLERDLNLLRQSEQAQERMLRDMQNGPPPPPEAFRQEERKLQDIRQKIHVYDIALRQQSGVSGGDGGMDLIMDGMMSRDSVQAMAAPKGFDSLPRGEVRLPAFESRRQSAPTMSGGMSGGMMPMDEGEAEVERVIYDPRRDGDLGQFLGKSLSGGGMSSSGDAGTEQMVPERMTIVAPGSVPPGQKYSIPSPSNPKPFAGATVGRAQFPPRKKIELPEDEWTPSPQSASRMPDYETDSPHPGLRSVRGEADDSSWPSFEVRPSRPAEKRGQDPSVERAVELKPFSPPAAEPERAEPKRIVVDIPSPEKPLRPSPKPEAATKPPVQVKIELRDPPAAKPRPAAEKKPPRAEPVNEVFVPDMFFSGR